jgi:putative spermidine/putrescine transport system permease protein
MSHKSFVWLCLLPLAVVTAAFFLVPMARLVVTGAEGPQGIAGYLAILTEPRYRATLINTVVLAAATTIVTLIVATIAGMFLQRHRFPGRAVLIAMLTFPLAFPGVVIGFLIILLAGRQGLIGDLTNRVFGEKLVFAYSIYGLFLGYLYFSIPRVILTIMAAVQKLDVGLEEAARSLGAGPWAVQRDVVLPALGPAFVASGAIAFATAMGAFGTAFTLATNIDVLPLLFTLLVAAFLVVPAILSISAGVTVNYFRGIQSGVTLQWVFQVWNLYAGTILLSFVIAFATLVVTLLVGVPAAYALHVRQGRLSRIVEEIITLPLAIPGLAIALALLLTYQGFSDFRRSWLFILTGHVIFTMPFMVRSVMAVFATVDIKTLDEGAASLGASPWQRFRDVIVPNAVPGILAGSLMVVTLSLGEFNLTWMLHTPLTKTLPIGLADSYASMRLEVASAYTLIFFVMIIPLLVAMQFFAEKEQKR